MEVNLGLWDKQIQYLEAKEKSVLLQCGVGFGKTFINCVFAILSVYRYPGKSFMMVARDVPQFKKAILPEMQKVLKKFGLQEGVDYDFNRQSLEFKFWNNTIIYCVGASNYDSAFRGPNIAIIIADEVEYYKKEAWTTMLTRLRVSPEILRCSSTPNGYNFVHDFFVVNNTDDKKVIVAPTFENLGLSKEYVDMLRQDYSPKLFEQEVLAKRLNLRVGAVYDEFNREIHVQDVKKVIGHSDQLFFFTDYNISNYCGVYMFKRGDILYVLAEEHLQFKGTREMADRIKAAFPNRSVIVVGDSTGNNKRDVAVTQTNYEVFRQAGIPTKHVHNPPVQSRIITVQSNLHHNRIVIDPSCKTLIRDLELVSWKEDGKDIDKSDLTLSHASDAFGYGVHYFIPLKSKSDARIRIT